MPTMPTFLPGPDLPVLQGRIGRDPRTEERRGRGQVEVRWNPQHEVLVDDDALGVAAERARRGAVVVRGAVGQREIGQYCSSPSRQFGHVRSESTRQPTPTTCPTLNRDTAGPTSTTRPMISCPGTHG